MISLDRNVYEPIVHVVQKDSGRSLICRISSYTIPTGCDARIYVKKPSGLAVYADAVISGNDIKVKITNQMLAEKGKARSQIQLVSNGAIVTSFEFILNVAESLIDNKAIESTNVFSALEDALIKINGGGVGGGSTGGGSTGGGSTGGGDSSGGSSVSGTGAGDHIDIRDFGAVDDGVTDNCDAFNSAFAAIPNGGTIQFPRTEHGYAIYDAIYVPEYVSLVGNKTEIIRKHDYHVHHNAFVFRGHNNFENFIFEGGGPDTVNYIQYTDFSIHGEGVVFQNNEVFNNRGTCIGGYGNCTIVNNFFNEFGDHLVYMGGGNTLTSGNYIFANNHIVAPNIRRDVMKFRNAGKNIIVSNNLYNVPNANVITFTNGDNYLDQGVMENLMITNNNIIASRYFCVIGQQLVGNDNNTGKIKNVFISNNIVNAKDYMIFGDSLLQDGDDMTNFVDTTITVSNNTFEQTPVIHITSVGKLHTIFEGNTFKNLNAGAGSLFAIRGSVDFDFTNNVIDQPDDGAWNLVTMANKFTAYKGTTTAPTRDVKWNIAGNTIHGVRILLAENVDGEAYFNEHTTTTIRDNILYKTGLISSLGTATGDGLIVLYNNLYYFAGELANLSVGRLNTVELGVGNMQTLTGSGSPVGTVVPRCVGDTYLDMSTKTMYTAFFKGDKNNGWYASGSGGGSSSGGSSDGGASEPPCQTGNTDPSGVAIPRWAGDRYINTATWTMYVALAALDKNTWFPIQRGYHFGSGSPLSVIFANGPGEMYLDTSTGFIWTAHARGSLSWICDKYTGSGDPNGFIIPKFVGDKYTDVENKVSYTAYAKGDKYSWKCDSGDSGGEEEAKCIVGKVDPTGSVVPRWAGDVYVDTATMTIYTAAAAMDKSTWIPGQRRMHVGSGDPNTKIFANQPGEVYLDTSTSIKWTAHARGGISWVAEFQVGEGSPVGVVPPRFVGDKYIDKENKKTYTGYIKLDKDNGWGLIG